MPGGDGGWDNVMSQEGGEDVWALLEIGWGEAAAGLLLQSSTWFLVLRGFLVTTFPFILHSVHFDFFS